jgi:hypothetical protein
MPIKSIAILFCALWLSLSIGIEVADQSWSKHWKIITICSSTCLCFCVAMFIMRGFLHGVLQDQQEEVWQKLEVEAYTPSSGDLMLSTFTFSNRGGVAIDKQHQISCFVNLIVSDVFEFAHNTYSRPSIETFEIRPGGDSQSYSCFTLPNGKPLIQIQLEGHKNPIPKCADVTLDIDYGLVTQPDQRRNKQVRFIANETDGYAWHRQAVEMPGSPCRAFKP